MTVRLDRADAIRLLALADEAHHRRALDRDEARARRRLADRLAALPPDGSDTGQFEDRLRELLGDQHVITTTVHGHRLVTVNNTDETLPWWYADDGTPGPSHGGRDRPCALCGIECGPRDPDACLGWVPDVWAACCGHGDRSVAYVAVRSGGIERGTAALEWLEARSVGPYVPAADRRQSWDPPDHPVCYDPRTAPG